MLELLLSPSSALLPEGGLLGFLLRHWLGVAVAVLALGFLLDQLFYVLLCRPQDRWRRRYRAFRAFLTRRFGAPPLPDAPAAPGGHPAPGGQSDAANADGPVIRRAAAR